MKGYMYILECAGNKYYVGSTINLEERMLEHQVGMGANFTMKNLPVKLIYFEEFHHIDDAFDREKQIQKWSRKKKKALIEGDYDTLREAAKCKNESRYR